MPDYTAPEPLPPEEPEMPDQFEPTTIFGRYRKLITVIVGLVIANVLMVTGSADVGVTTNEWIAIAISVATAFGVYAVPNQQ